MANVSGWDQSQFDKTIKEALVRHPVSTWPKFLNKRMFFVTLKAFGNTPALRKGDLGAELDRQVLARRANGTMDMVRIGDVMVAKRVSKYHTSSARFERQATRELQKEMGGRGKGADYRDAWLKNLREGNKSLRGGRAASVGFLRAGFVSILYALGPIVGQGRPARGPDTKVRGQVKGSVVHLADSKNLKITIENRAHSRTENLGGFERIGNWALEKAFTDEGAELYRHLHEEMEPHERTFNRQQR